MFVKNNELSVIGAIGGKLVARYLIHAIKLISDC